MKKWCLIVAILLFVVLCLSSCGYNSVMYDYLSDADHYKTYTATVVDIKRESQSAVLYVIFSSKTEIAPFYGVSEDELDKDCSEYIVRLEIVSENDRILCENGFYDIIKVGDRLQLQASDWIYQDGEFFYISSIVHDDIVYLSEADGLENIVEMMKKNKSLL